MTTSSTSVFFFWCCFVFDFFFGLNFTKATLTARLPSTYVLRVSSLTRSPSRSPSHSLPLSSFACIVHHVGFNILPLLPVGQRAARYAFRRSARRGFPGDFPATWLAWTLLHSTTLCAWVVVPTVLCFAMYATLTYTNYPAFDRACMFTGSYCEKQRQ